VGVVERIVTSHNTNRRDEKALLNRP